jgi:hypothetical protein
LNFVKDGKLEFLEQEMWGRKQTVYRTDLDAQQSKGNNVALQGTLLPPKTLMTLNQMNKVGKSRYLKN